MAKINAPKGFEKGQLDSGTLEKIEPFVDYVSANFEQIIRAFTNQITFPDNFNATIRTLSVKHNVPFTIPSVGRAVTGVMLMSAAGVNVRSFSYVQNSENGLAFTFKFDSAIPIKTQNATYSAPFVRYQTTSLVSVGDIVSISDYANEALNGTFIVSADETINTKFIACYNQQTGVAAETKTSYSGEDEVSKSVTLLITY